MTVDISHYKEMWTTEKEDYWLVPARDGNGLSIYYLGAPGTLVLDDEDELQPLIARMLQEGVRIATVDEMNQHFDEAIGIPPDFLKRDDSETS